VIAACPLGEEVNSRAGLEPEHHDRLQCSLGTSLAPSVGPSLAPDSLPVVSSQRPPQQGSRADLVLGLDFDNTIVDYDSVFYERALERNLIPADVEPTKTGVRAWLRAAGREDVWTELQGDVYGSCMLRARPAEGVLDFLRACAQRHVPLAIISHKTLYPFLGPKVNLHDAARGWIAHHGLAALGLPPERCYFELTKQAKLERVGALGCTHFVDDLTEILLDPGFPPGVERLHYAPSGEGAGDARLTTCTSWRVVSDTLLGQA
jgi:hypothetical protein